MVIIADVIILIIIIIVVIIISIIVRLSTQDFTFSAKSQCIKCFSIQWHITDFVIKSI